MNLKTLRIKGLNKLRNLSVIELIDLCNPEAIVLEDIDHSYPFYDDTSESLLEKLEKLNLNKKYVFATANDLTKINTALLRPGRFDELIEINHLSPEAILKMLNNDSELLEMVKDYPVAYIMELKKRIQALGKEEALSGLSDLELRLKKNKNINKPNT